MHIDGIRELWSASRVGFRIDEVMSGEHEFEPGCGPPGRRPMEYRLTWGPESIRAWLRPSDEKFLWQEARGDISVDGLCTAAPCAGTLALRYLSDRRLVYTLDFEAEGVGYRYVRRKGQHSPMEPADIAHDLLWSHRRTKHRQARVDGSDVLQVAGRAAVPCERAFSRGPVSGTDAGRPEGARTTSRRPQRPARNGPAGTAEPGAQRTPVAPKTTWAEKKALTAGRG